MALSLNRARFGISLLCLTGADAALMSRVVKSQADSTASFLLVSGITSPQEMCLQGNGKGLNLKSCVAAIAEGNGGELWSLQAGGQLMNEGSKLCAGASSPQPGSSVGLVDCKAAGTLALQADGQAKVGDLCLSQAGAGAGLENAALWAAAYATSSASMPHGAGAAVDADPASFWASKADDADPVTFTVDLGEARAATTLSISWEFPPLAFAVETSADEGHTWTAAFDTSVNMVHASSIPLPSGEVQQVRIVMREPHPVFGRSAGHSLYGIRSMAVLTSPLHAILEDCATAAQSVDARDKYFASYASGDSARSAAALQAELPALIAARASLSSTLAQLAAVVPALPSCRNSPSMLARAGKSNATALSASIVGSSASAGSELQSLVSTTFLIDTTGVADLLAASRKLVRDVRQTLLA